MLLAVIMLLMLPAVTMMIVRVFMPGKDPLRKSRLRTGGKAPDYPFTDIDKYMRLFTMGGYIMIIFI